jgi:hypothetical protein
MRVDGRVGERSMKFAETAEGLWELLLLDPDPPMPTSGCLTAGDIDADGRIEVLVGGEGKLVWYRPGTFERGVAAEGQFSCSLALADVDGDGRPELFAGHSAEDGSADQMWVVSCFRPTADLSGPWPRHTVDPDVTGNPHDVIAADLDGDGEVELIVTAVYCSWPGLFIYKAGDDPAEPWLKHMVQEGRFGDGTAAADVDGDGFAEILSGPYLWHCPPGGPFAGPWTRTDLAPGFREMCRAGFVDVTGSGRPDAVVAEAEFLDGRLSWFENRVLEDPGSPWVEHPLDRSLYYAHSMRVWRDSGGDANIFVAEMAEGGWKAPRNRGARLMKLSTVDGREWCKEVISRGTGTHEATMLDVDGDGQLEVVGKQWQHTKVQIWKKRREPTPLACFRHCFLDRDKPDTAVDIMATDVDGDGLADVVCGSWWYRSPSWERRDLPEGFEALCAHDLDSDGRDEIVALKRTGRGYEGLTSDLWWLKPIDPLRGEWDAGPIGRGRGDWPHGSLVAPLLAGGRLALVAGYHNAGKGNHPEIFEVPEDLGAAPWPKHVLAEVPYGEEFAAADVTGDGRLDIVAGPWWLENDGRGGFRPHEIARGFKVARIAMADVNGDGRLDVIAGEEILDFENRVTPISRLVWFEHPEDPAAGLWQSHVIDKVRCPHSLGVADLDGDGEPEIVCGEHDPFYPYRSRCRLLLFKQAAPEGTSWRRYVLDDRFEHHDGARIIKLADGRSGIISHGWKDSKYVHLWEPA